MVIAERLNQVKQFVKEVHVEGKKVSWPKKEHLLAATMAVLFSIIIIAIFLATIDYLFSFVFKSLPGLLGKLRR